MSIYMNDIKDGFPTKEDALNFLIINKFKFVENYRIVKFNNQYYCVGFQNTTKEVVVMKDLIWYIDEIGETKVISTSNLDCSVIPNFKKGKIIDLNGSVYEDMKNINSDMCIFNISKTGKNYNLKICTTKKNCFYVLVGIYFYDFKFSQETIKEVNGYFKNCDEFIKLFNYKITHLNPFRAQAFVLTENNELKIPVLYTLFKSDFNCFSAEYKLKHKPDYYEQKY